MAVAFLKYLDASAVVRNLTLEPHSRALRVWLGDHSRRTAASVPWAEVNLAAAMELGDSLAAIVTYDRRMIDAADALGLPVVSPL